MISVIMPVYNSAPYLKESIQSVLNQSEQDFELIVINDGSTDASENIILNFNDPRIRYFKQKNLGAANARNKALEMARGDFIAFQDSDDISMPNRFSSLKEQFKKGVGIVHSDMMLIDQNNYPIGYWHARNIDKSNLNRFFLKIGTPINGGSVMFRRQLVGDLKYDLSLQIGEDTNFIYELLKICESSIHIPEPLYIYRKHLTNTTNQGNYDVLYLHVQKFIQNHDIKELVPEVEWNRNDDNENEATASAILALLLFNRGMYIDGEKHILSAINRSENLKSKQLIYAIAKLINGKPDEALEYLYAVDKKNHLVENYIGEALVYLGEIELAYHHFLSALNTKPDYIEPIDNLKAISSRNSFNMLDRNWIKF
ncbi:glycosyltransferase [Paenibacillus sp. AK121]|nr:glycosyltransferase [Paenibacillus sp. AK121]MBU9706449.1 glycosyltransferase [Paenibacillus sp. AK121]